MKCWLYCYLGSPLWFNVFVIWNAQTPPVHHTRCLIHWWVTGMCRTPPWRMSAVCQVSDFLQQLWCLRPSLLPPWVHTAWVPWTWGPYLAASTPPARVGQWWGGGWKRRTSKAPVGGNSICSKCAVNGWRRGKIQEKGTKYLISYIPARQKRE